MENKAEQRQMEERNGGGEGVCLSGSESFL